MSRKDCPRCGAPLDPETQDCARCLLALAQADSEMFEDFADDEDADLPALEEIARLLPQYEIDRRVGRGGMGVVFAARDRKLQRQVALKILNRDLSNSEDFVRRFLREGRALAALNHPNIVTIHDFGLEEGLCYLVMELVEGADLRQLIAAGELKSDQALALVPQICDALQYAHERGVVHRDIKPENILVRPDGLVKVADFGIAKMADEPGSERLTHSRLVMGTPQYMAPEQVEHPLDVDHRADIYALGVVLYEMLTGELPLGRFEPPSARVLLDLRIDEVVLRSLEKSPERRYQAASEVKSEVDHIRTTPSEAAASIGAGPGDERAPLVPRAIKAAGKVGWFALKGTSGIWWALFLFAVVSVATFTVNKIQDLFDVKPLEQPETDGISGDVGEGARPATWNSIGRANFELANRVIRDGSVEEVRSMLKEAAPVRMFGEDKIEHPLFAATRRGDIEILRLVTASFPDQLEPTDEEGETPLVAAIETGFGAGALLLIEKGCVITQIGPQGRSPLLMAALKGEVDVLRALLRHLPKAALYHLDQQNEGVMHKAARSGKVEVIEALRQAGIEGGFHNDRDMTSLDLAVAAGHREVFAILLESGDDPTPAYQLRLALDEDGDQRAYQLGTLIARLDKAPRDQLEIGSPRGRVVIKRAPLVARLMALEAGVAPEIAERLLKEALDLWPEGLPALDLLDIRELSAGVAWKRVRISKKALADWEGGPLPLTTDGNEGTRPESGLLKQLEGY